MSKDGMSKDITYAGNTESGCNKYLKDIMYLNLS